MTRLLLIGVIAGAAAVTGASACQSCSSRRVAGELRRNRLGSCASGPQSSPRAACTANDVELATGG